MVNVDIILPNLTFPTAVNHAPFNESVINSTTTAHMAIGRCSSDNLTNYKEHVYDGQEIACALYKPYITEQFGNGATMMPRMLLTMFPVVRKTGDDVDADVFGSSDPSGDCTSGKTCAYDRIYAHTDDCRAYAFENERSYWLVRSEVRLIGAKEITTLCAICTADFTAEDAPDRPEVSLDFTQVSNVCAASLPPPPPPPPPPSSGLSVGAIIGIVVGVLVGVGVVAAGVALYTGVVTPATLSFGLIGAKPPTTLILSKFPATFEVTRVGLKK